MLKVRNITVLVVDDSLVLRERVLEMLGEIPGIDILGCAEDGLNAVNCIRQMRPAVVILDIQMPHGTGLDVLRNIRPVAGAPLFIVFTNFPYPQYRKRALESGAQYFFDKTTEFDKLRELFSQLTSSPERHQIH